MFKDHPKGLPVLFFTEMWERFGYYTMLAILVYYLGENFGWDAKTTTSIYGWFLAGVYITPIIGGWLADNVFGYSKTIIMGAIVMGLGYAMIAIPTDSAIQVYAALVVIAIGNGLFKANISVLVGNLYTHANKELKDSGYNIFYMGINIGAFYAPMAAQQIRQFVMETFGVSMAQGYNAGFAIASLGMVFSLLVFVLFRKRYAEADYQSKNKMDESRDVALTPQQEKQRIFALLAVFTVVIFFWMAFHQNGSALSLFARDYTDREVSSWVYLLFDIWALHGLLFVLIGGVLALRRQAEMRKRLIAAAAALLGGLVVFWRANEFSGSYAISPEYFQVFNPMFIVLMTPLIVTYFRQMNKRGKEPSSPGKIGIGMVITGLAYILMIVASLGLPAVYTLAGGTSPETVSVFWLIGTYYMLTVAELHLSPMGLSFVSKVSPAKLKGLMMGGWFGATAIGNYLSGFVGRFYQDWELWQFFALLVVTSFAAALLMAVMLRRLNAATGESDNREQQ
jgi:POT family proton-dependent oligopeptide transporter